MNWTMWIVLSAIVVLVPMSLFAALRVSHDVAAYDRHYDAYGFSTEICEHGPCKVVNADSVMVAEPVADDHDIETATQNQQKHESYWS